MAVGKHRLIGDEPEAFGGLNTGLSSCDYLISKWVQRWLGGLEITKRAMLIVTGKIKSALYACSDQKTIDWSIFATRVALNELERLSAEYNFDVKVFSIHPYQELDAAFRKTEQSLRTAMPNTFEYFGTGDQFKKARYFPYDGHFNADGHANMATSMERSLVGSEPQKLSN